MELDMDVPFTRLAIYAALEKLLVPAQLPALWEQCSAPSGYFETPPDPEQCLKQLQDQFSLAELVAAGVFLAPASPDTQPELHPALQVPGTKMLALRNPSGPFDFLTNHGCLSGRLPVLASQDDDHVRQLLRTTDCDLLVAATVEDAATLLAAALPATISTGLTQLRGVALNTFCEAFDLPRPGQKLAAQEPSATASPPNIPPVNHRAKSLILVAWSPAQLSLAAPGQQDVRQYFSDLYRHLGLPIQNFGWWRPAKSELVRLAFAVQTLDQAGISALLRNCIDVCEPVVPITQIRPAPKPTSASSAVQPGKRSVLNPLASEQDASLWRERLDREVFGPLFQALKKSACPLVKNLRYAHYAATVALHNYSQRVVATYGTANKDLDSDETRLVTFSNLQVLMDVCQKLTREIRAAEKAIEGEQPGGTYTRVTGAKNRQCQPARSGSSSG
jgi:hypothetical protein